MRQAHGITLLTSSLLFLAACDGTQLKQERRLRNFRVTADDFNVIAEAAFKRIDPQENIKLIVVPATLDPRAVAALQRVRQVATFTPASPAANELLPAGHFLVRKFEIDASDAEPSASIEGQLGPVTRTLTAANLPDCGKIYSIAYFLRGGDWYNPSYKVETCAESRHWVPVDAVPNP